MWKCGSVEEKLYIFHNTRNKLFKLQDIKTAYIVRRKGIKTTANRKENALATPFSN